MSTQPEEDTPDPVEAVLLAALLQAGVRTISRRLVTVLLSLWAEKGPDPKAWRDVLPAATGAFRAAQTAAAGMGDLYVEASKHTADAVSVRAAIAAARRSITLPPVAGAGVDVADAIAEALIAVGAVPRVSPAGSAVEVAAAAFAGQTGSGLTVPELLSVPAGRAVTALAGGASPTVVDQAARAALTMYAQTEIPDAARAATQAAMVSRQVTGYIRHVGARCCARCAILSGKWYPYNAGFDRHPHCRCVHTPATRDVPVTSPEQLFREGRITDLTRAEREAVRLGADMSQVVNARQGMYVAGGQRFTTQGTTRRGIAGARMLAAQIQQAAGGPSGAVFTNFTISASEVATAEAKYGPLMRRGVPFLRKSPLGGASEAAYRFTNAQRPSVATILRLASTREEAERLLINFGYLLRPGQDVLARIRAAS